MGKPLRHVFLCVTVPREIRIGGRGFWRFPAQASRDHVVHMTEWACHTNACAGELQSQNWEWCNRWAIQPWIMGQFQSGIASVNMWETWRRCSEICHSFAPQRLPKLWLWQLARHAAATGEDPLMCQRVSCRGAGTYLKSHISASEGYISSYVFTKDVAVHTLATFIIFDLFNIFSVI